MDLNEARARLHAAVDAIPDDRVVEVADLRHSVLFTDEGWTVAHPLSERLDGSVFDCPVHFHHLDGPPIVLGRFWIEADGSLTPMDDR